jgi:hypothetical protein
VHFGEFLLEGILGSFTCNTAGITRRSEDLRDTIFPKLMTGKAASPVLALVDAVAVWLEGDH